uniref:C-type lectin domain-containing protein n=1 Tax=Oryzias sinensis TaxID=183150 RepID=A0A8C7XNM5_9TELE
RGRFRKVLLGLTRNLSGVGSQKSWLDAQAHCRSQHTDLSSIRSLAENAQISFVTLLENLLGGGSSTSTSPTSAWIGLHRSLWAWSDGSSATFRQFGLVQSNGRDDCVLMESSSSTWFWRPCTEYHPFLCNTGEFFTGKRTQRPLLSASRKTPVGRFSIRKTPRSVFVTF